MSRLKPLLAFLAFVSFGSPAQSAAAPAENPFAGFEGSYRVLDVECLRDGYPWRGCSLVALTVLKKGEQIELSEFDGDMAESVFPESYSRKSPDGTETSAELSGDGQTQALWERYLLNAKTGKTELTDLRFFFRESGKLYYQIYRRDLPYNGEYRIFKETYTLFSTLSF